MATELPVNDLRIAITRLLDAVEDKFGLTLRFEDDLYWNVPLRRVTAVDSAPELDIGSVVDDATSVSQFATRQEEFAAIWHESDHIAGVLRAIARLDLPPE